MGCADWKRCPPLREKRQVIVARDVALQAVRTTPVLRRDPHSVPFSPRVYCSSLQQKCFLLEAPRFRGHGVIGSELGPKNELEGARPDRA
jgi:hypothetical protein